MSYQVITELTWGQQPRGVNTKPWSENEELYSAGSLIIEVVDTLCHAEINEAYLESLPAVFERLEQSNCNPVLIAQASMLLDEWLLRGRPSWGGLIERLNEAMKHLRSLAETKPKS
ncbi:hypothetical protein [Kamptonema sp. PCC 6506]|uniref:hypothetical protein n=1 Tax=Kamptonema sp. PCC 6506 TaxID=272129 RepID=UPI0001DAD273|nr:hypothetical protein [Kamptonema sp. PCC 6506]CBN58284.1 hypothetical protein OSCI_3720003 [Kamptonema sp. PCC 6506]